MSNPLTGDFEAVLQVSGATINRLLATLHQNAFSDAQRPSFPHVQQMRLGDTHAVDGVRGVARVQVGVPRVTLFDGATDRFRLAVAIRAWFTPDPGTGPFPAFVNGTVTADYQLVPIDPHCLGWSQRASQYLWIRVVPDSVVFVGSADDDIKALDAAVIVSMTDAAAAAAADIARIKRQIAWLLATRFEASPHPVSAGFERGRMRSLDNPLSGTAVSMPIGLSGPPVGDIASMDTVVLDGADLAVAISVGYVMSVVEPALDPIRAFHETIKIHIDTPWPAPDIDTVYRVTVGEPTAEWQPHDTYAVVQIKVSGAAKTDSILPNVTFDIVQDIVLTFDAGTSRIVASAGGSGVTASASGLYSGTVADVAKNAIKAALPPLVHIAINAAQPQLDSATRGLGDLTTQLRTLDARAAVALIAARFLRDGILVKGRIDLTPRKAPGLTFSKAADGSALTALSSWIPGGRIDRFEWTWTWFGNGTPGHATRTDRFLLRRPAVAVSRWGLGLGASVPLPGLDGSGQVCLTVVGVAVDAVTGAWVPVRSTVHCQRFGIAVTDGFTGATSPRGRLFLVDGAATRGQVPVSQRALVGVPRAAGGATGPNVLVVHVGESWTDGIAWTLAHGLERCARHDAALSVLVLFRPGILEHDAGRAADAIAGIMRKQGVGIASSEDVHGAWAGALGFAGATTGWAILGPRGQPLWTHVEPLEAHGLAHALDTHLRQGDAAGPSSERLAVEVGSTFDPRVFQTVDQGQPTVAHCPPPPFGTRTKTGAVLVFAQAASMASLEAVRRAAAASRTPVVAIVDHATSDEASSFGSTAGHHVEALADQAGAIADRLGIGVWPTTIAIDASGRVSSVIAGIADDHQH